MRAGGFYVLFTALSLLGCAAEAPSGGAAALGIEVVEITEADLAALPPGEQSVIDLALDDVVYRVDAPASLADERIVVRSAAGHEETLGVVLEGREASGVRKLTLAGDPGDIDALRRGVPAEVAPEGEVAGASEALLSTGSFGSVGCGGSLSFSCGWFTCSCTGDDDCNDMFCSGVCGGDAVCDETSGTYCWCVRWGSRLYTRY